jgi:hypothetical protein
MRWTVHLDHYQPPSPNQTMNCVSLSSSGRWCVQHVSFYDEGPVNHLMKPEPSLLTLSLVSGSNQISCIATCLTHDMMDFFFIFLCKKNDLKEKDSHPIFISLKLLCVKEGKQEIYRSIRLFCSFFFLDENCFYCNTTRTH